MPSFYCGHTLILRANFVQNADEKQAVVSFDVTNSKYVTASQCDGAYVSSISSCAISVTQGRIIHTHLSERRKGEG
ncbi:hypothetical protein CJP72_13695 [Citrobacter sp. NCU1]|nr:hypothetical protein [Citrobacter sp. NCU1]